MIRTFETENPDDDLKYSSEKKSVKITTDDLAGELEKLTNEKTRMVKVKILRQYADELKVGKND